MGVECNEPSFFGNLNSNNNHENELPSNDSNFENGIVHLNPVLIKKREERMPNYAYKRFANECDFNRAFPLHAGKAERALNAPLDCRTLKNLKFCEGIEDKVFQHLLTTTAGRIEGGSNLQLLAAMAPMCSFWLAKEKPLSVTESPNYPLNGKIYASISVNHTVSDDFVFVQETDEQIGYISPLFAAKATVAFPPILEGEVWTVGWIQATTKADSEIKVKDDRENGHFT